jgi:type IV secretion system protein VirB6
MATTPGLHLFADIFNRIDTITATFVTSISSNVITNAMPVITAGLTVTFIFYGLLVARGAVEDSVRDFVFKCFKIGVIVSIASAGGLYQSSIASAITTTPDEFATALLPSSSNASQAQGSTAANVIDNAAQKGFDKAEEAFEAVSALHPGQAFALVMIAILTIIATAILTAIGGAFILLAKIALAILAGLGPLFILALLFKSTQRFFEAWCGQVITYGLMIVLMSSVFGVVMDMFGSYVSGMAVDGLVQQAASVGGCIILAVACLVILMQIPSIAGALASGVGVGLWHELSTASRGASKAAKVGMAGGKAAVATGKAAYSGGKSLAGGVSKAVGRFKGSARA